MSAAEWRLAVEAAFQLSRASLELRLVPRRRTVAFFAHLDGDEHSSEAAARAETRRITWAVLGVAGRLPWHPTCLRQAIAAQRMLRARGIASRLQLGVRRDEGKLVAHAWVTAGDRVVVGGGGLDSYQPLLPHR